MRPAMLRAVCTQTHTHLCDAGRESRDLGALCLQFTLDSVTSRPEACLDLFSVSHSSLQHIDALLEVRQLTRAQPLLRVQLGQLCLRHLLGLCPLL